MKRITALFLTILFLLSACGQPSNSQSGGSQSGSAQSEAQEHKISIVSTIFPGYDFARAVAGEHADLTMLLPPGAESHSYDPTPSDIITIQNCAVFLYTGGESDTWVDSVLESMDTSNMTVISMMELVDTVEEEIKAGMEDDHSHDASISGSEGDHSGEEPEYDEHVWTSPVNAIRMTQAIADTLCSLDGNNEDTYRANCAAYVEQLEGLDASFREIVQNAQRDTLIFGDRFPFRYFVDEYGLDYYAAFPGCSSETEASAQTVAFLIDKVQEEKIPVVFYIEFSNEKMADTICETTGAKKLLLHSCHNVTRDEFLGGMTYVALMERNVAALKEALS